jgi:CRISPR-associated protein, csn1 family
MAQKSSYSPKRYSLGLDIGTSSVGWAVLDLDKERIHDLGVRIFERPEVPKTGKSLAEPRRIARSARHRLRRRRQRLNYLKRFFIDNNLISEGRISDILSPTHPKKWRPIYDPYTLRIKGLNEKLSPEELFVALYHIAKRRGYKSNRISIEEQDVEGSQVLSAISENKLLLEKYKTKSVAKVLTLDEKFKNNKRNKTSTYKNSFVRKNFEDEVMLLLESQKKFGLKLPYEKIQTLLYGNVKNGNYNGIFSQRPFMTRELIEKMRGNCEFEPEKPRAPKASYSFELFRLAQNLSHLRIVVDQETRQLSEDEIAKIIEKAKNVKVLKYEHIRDILGYKGDQSFSFAQGMIRGKIKNDDKKNGEGNKFDSMIFYHTVKKAFEQHPKDWSILAANNFELLDRTGLILTVNKDDSSLRRELSKLNISTNAIESLLPINVSSFVHLSFESLHKITPWLLKGLNYNESVERAGYSFSQNLSGNKKELPPLSEKQAAQITNPVVKRAVSQTIKVVNAIIRKYGIPYSVKIEAANELAKNAQERDKIKKIQDENAAYNEKIKQKLINEFNIPTPTGLQITKFKLREQQNGVSIYSGKEIRLENLFADEHYGEIDHIIPFSRCGNDGLNNKVLVFADENQEKGNLTPYETWGGDNQKWIQFEARVRATAGLPAAKRDRLLSKSKPVEDWNVRALNDTRYISRFLRQYIRDNLDFPKIEGKTGTQRVFSPSGPITSYLRRVWRVGNKNRDDNNLHHATDACIIAATDPGIIQKVSSLNKYYELFKYSDKNEVIDKLTGEVLNRNQFEQHIADLEPWDDFGKEVRKRSELYNTPSELHNELTGLKNYDEEFRLSTLPIFVSRMPKRSGKGSTNSETFRSPKIIEGYLDEKGRPAIARKQRVPLRSVDLKKLYDSPIRETDPKLYKILEQRLKDFNDNPVKAFAENIYKPTKDSKCGNIVRSIKIYNTRDSKSGFLVNEQRAFVNNGKTIRLDVYKRKNYKGIYEYYFTPVYTHLINTQKIEVLPTPTGRSKKEKADFDTIRTDDGEIYATLKNGFIKQFSIYPNDYVRIYFGNEIVEGYYVKYNTNDGSLKLIKHSETSKNDNDLISKSAKTATLIKRYDISVLGDNYRWL